MKRFIFRRSWINISFILVCLLIPPTAVFGDTPLEIRCKSALEMDLNIKISRESVIALIDEIKKQENLYLKSGLYRKILDYYGILQGKIGDYYYKHEQLEKALQHYIEAGKYSKRGFWQRINNTRNKQSETLFHRFVPRGSDGYSMLQEEKNKNTKIHFHNFFFTEISRRFKQKGTEKVLETYPFWKKYREDSIFLSNRNINQDNNQDNTYLPDQKQLLDDIYNKARNQFIEQLQKKTALLVPPKKLAEIPPDVLLQNITKYTGNQSFVDSIKAYIDIYYQIQEIIPPSDKRTTTQVIYLLQALYSAQPIILKLKDMLDDYIRLWEDFYGISDGDSYTQKENTCRRKSDRLAAIIDISNKIHLFGINDSKPKLEKQLQILRKQQRLWNLHSTAVIIIREFEAIHSPSWHHLMKTRKQLQDIQSSLNRQLDTNLKTLMEPFLRLPEKSNLSLKELEEFLSYRKNTPKISAVLKAEFRQRLEAQLDNLMHRGGNSLVQLKKIREIEKRFWKINGKNSRWSHCLSSLIRYYEALDKNDYPTLMELYDNVFSNQSTCTPIFPGWISKSREEIKTQYRNYFNREIEKYLGDGENVRFQPAKDDFNRFINLYLKTRRYFTLTQDQGERYNSLKNYWESSSRSQINRAIEELYRGYPLLAQRYAIPRPLTTEEIKPPDKPVITQKKTGTYNENSSKEKLNREKSRSQVPITKLLDHPKSFEITGLLEFLDTLFNYIKTARLSDPGLQAICGTLINSKLSGPEFFRIIGNNKKIIPPTYDLMMNLFFYLINTREKGWRLKAEKVLENAEWPMVVKKKMKFYLSVVTDLYE